MASQDKGWQTYYERAWEARADFMRQLLRDGCNGVKLNAQQIIGRLRAKDRLEKMQIEFKGSTKVLSYGWQPRQFTQKNKSFIGIPWLRPSSLMGREVSVPFYTDCHEDRFLIDIINHSGPYDAIVELGCGFGANLFDIFYHGGPVDIPYYGGEFTASGEQIARELAAAAEGMRAEFFHFNHLEPDLSRLAGKYRRLFVFTVHTIEQVMEIPGTWFSEVAKAAPFVRCVHIEPFGFQIKELGSVCREQREYFIRNTWNLNLADVLFKAISKKEITLEDLMLDYNFTEDGLNQSSCAVWTHGEDACPPRQI